MATHTITKNNFQSEVIESEKTVLLDFWAPWCGPCRILSPVVDQVSNEVADIKVGKVNIDEEQELAQAFGVMSIPTLAVLKGGKVVNKAVGVQPKRAILEMVK